MEKLIKKFEDIIQDKLYFAKGKPPIGIYNASNLCAKECKQIACDFAYYMYTNHIDASLTMDKIFNEFLEQYRNDLYNNYDKNVLI